MLCKLIAPVELVLGGVPVLFNAGLHEIETELHALFLAAGVVPEPVDTAAEATPADPAPAAAPAPDPASPAPAPAPTAPAPPAAAPAKPAA